MPPLPFGQRILILVPHPDDEVVGFCAALGRAQAQGAEGFALYLTHGCIARETLWPWQRKHYERNIARRHAEAENVARFLGITPVGWSDRPARHLWRKLPEVLEEVHEAIAAHNIDQVWLPAYEGGNADHDGLNAVGQVLGSKIPQTHGDSLPLSVLEFAEYNFHGHRTCAQTFPHPNGTEHTLLLTPEEQAKKREALRLYASERQNLNYVGTTRECFRPLGSYDYSQPPHEGTLWYTRFHWVPFRHPRVDFTTPQDVSEAIFRFLKT